MTVNRKYLRDKIANALLIGDDAIEISRLCLALLDEVDVLDDDLENTRMRLIACQCVAEANTREGAKNMRDVQEAWQSPAFRSVCDAVDREIDLREKLEAAEAREKWPRAALVQARGALLLDAMVDEHGNRYGTTMEALKAIEIALAETAP